MRGAFPRLDPAVAAACIVGAFMEALVGPLAPAKGTGARADRHLVEQITQFCLRASVGAAEDKAMSTRFAPPSVALPADGYATHEVMNQATPLTGHNAFTGDRLLTEIAGREKIGWADGLLAEAGKTVASARVAEAGARRQPPPARAQEPRPLRPPHRRDRVPSGVARADVAGDRPRHACAVMDRPAARRARRARHALLPLEPGRERHLLSARHDLFGGSGAAPAA